MDRFVSLPNRVALFEVQSKAMEPTFPAGSKWAVERFFYARNPVERWHVVLLLLSSAETDMIPRKISVEQKDGTQQEYSAPHFPYMKRVVGLPGETIMFTESEILCNGRPLKIPSDVEENYKRFDDPRSYTFGSNEFEISDEHVFVLSDNIREGIDSRRIGPVPLKCILGRIVC